MSHSHQLIGLILFGVLALNSCDGVQRGRYVQSGSATYALQSNGSLQVVSGHPAGSGGSHTGAEANLLYVLITYSAPPPGFRGGGSGQESGTHVSKFWHEWTGTRSHRLEYTWDRDHHTLDVAGQRFEVATGNLFVIHLDAQWKPSTHQISRVLTGLPVEQFNGNDWTLLERVLTAFKEGRPTDPLIQTAKFGK